MFDAANFPQRHRKLTEEIAESKRSSESLEQHLAEMQSAWAKFYDDAATEMGSRLEEIDVAAMLTLIEQEAEDLSTNDQLLSEIQKLEQLEFVDDETLGAEVQAYS